jgi:hypothetical protein
MKPQAEWTPAQSADATRQVAAMLRKQADLVLKQLDILEDAAEHLCSMGPDVGKRAKAALVRHSIDCSTKLGWAANAVAMYLETLIPSPMVRNAGLAQQVDSLPPRDQCDG